MKKLLVVLALLIAGYQFAQHGGLRQERSHDAPTPATSITADVESSPTDALAAAFENQQSNVQVEGRGTVQKILPDDDKGSRHQRFIVRLSSRQTVLIAHNIDLAPRIDELREGDEIAFAGEYEWNNKGGVIHWTHLDPQGRHEAGWIAHNGRRYQ